MLLTVTQNVIYGFGVDIKADNGLMYSSNGVVVDPQTGMRVGTLTGPGFGSLVAPDSATGRVYFLTPESSGVALRAYDMRTFLPIAAVRITSVSGTPTSLIRWGAVGLAFRTDTGRVYLVRTHIVPAANQPSDFDSDGKADEAIWRPTNGNWHIRQSSDSSSRVQYDWGSGALGDVAVPGDYDGDRKTDFAVWRVGDGNWYILQSVTNTVRVHGLGLSGDVCVPSAYLPQ